MVGNADPAINMLKVLQNPANMRSSKNKQFFQKVSNKLNTAHSMLVTENATKNVTQEMLAWFFPLFAQTDEVFAASHRTGETIHRDVPVEAAHPLHLLGAIDHRGETDAASADLLPEGAVGGATAPYLAPGNVPREGLMLPNALGGVKERIALDLGLFSFS